MFERLTILTSRGMLGLQAWASADFFPGEGKIFLGGGQKHTICLKRYFFASEKVKKHTIFAGQGGQEPVA